MAGERLAVGFIDYSKEESSVGVGVGAVTAVSLPGLLTQIASYITAIDAITLGTVRDDTLTAYSTNRSSVPPTDPNAQRERKWMVVYTDNQQFFDPPTNAIPNAGFGKKFRIEVPTANFDLVDVFPTNSDEADLGQAQIAAFVTALEAMARSPYGGTIEVLSITGVGRSL